MMDPVTIVRMISILSSTVIEIAEHIGVTEQEVPSLLDLKTNVAMLHAMPDLPEGDEGLDTGS